MLLKVALHTCCSQRSVVYGESSRNANHTMENCTPRIILYTKNIASHKSAFKFTGPEDEIDLILCQPSMFTKNECLSIMEICPNHRAKLRLRWTRGSSTRCRVLERISNHGKGKGVRPKGERGLGKRESEVILRKTGSFVQVGSDKFYFLFSRMVYPDVEFGHLTDGHLTAFLHHSGVCRTCRERLKEMIDTEVRERMTLVSITHNVTK